MSHHRLGGQHGVVWLQVSCCFRHSILSVVEIAGWVNHQGEDGVISDVSLSSLVRSLDTSDLGPETS